MARVLVTGSRGLLGCDLVPRLAALGHEVIGHAHTKPARVSCDLADAAQAWRVLDDVAPEFIINLVANTNVDDCERHPQRAYLANVRVVENLASWIRNTGGKCQLVQISTDQIYDGSGLHEESDVTISNYYGFSKYAGELAAAGFAVILRTNFFGPSHCEGRASLSDWLARSFRDGKPITVFDDVYFSPLSIARLADSIATVIRKPVPGTYNLGSREGVTKAAFAFAFAKALALSTAHATIGSADHAKLAAYRPKDMRMDSSRFERTFGVTLPTLAEEIDSMRHAYAQEA